MTPPDVLAGLPVLFVMAAEPEYGPMLRRRISPLMTGVGPVEAGVALAADLAARRAAGRLPGLVVSLGSAGSARLEQGSVHQIAAVGWRDIDASALGFPRGTVPFLDQPAEIPLPYRIPGLPAARLSTGADVVSGAAYARIDADMVDMETYAHLRACQRFGVPLIGLRGVSDGAADLGGLSDWTALLGVIDGRLAEAVDRLEAAIAAGLMQTRHDFSRP
ncbi:MAG: 5'-methylthioadenosine/S-adenosylhomocysteine nucleosidase [Gemmobacter sp.]